jgi:hypothetical protein
MPIPSKPSKRIPGAKSSAKVCDVSDGARGEEAGQDVGQIKARRKRARSRQAVGKEKARSR